MSHLFLFNFYFCVCLYQVESSFMPSSTLDKVPRQAREPVAGDQCRLAGWGATVEVRFYFSEICRIID